MNKLKMCSEPFIVRAVTYFIFAVFLGVNCVALLTLFSSIHNSVEVVLMSESLHHTKAYIIHSSLSNSIDHKCFFNCGCYNAGQDIISNGILQQTQKCAGLNVLMSVQHFQAR